MPKEIGGELYYTLDEIEDILKTSPAKVLDLINENKLTAKKIDDEWLVSEAALKEYRDTEEQQT